MDQNRSIVKIINLIISYYKEIGENNVSSKNNLRKYLVRKGKMNYLVAGNKLNYITNTLNFLDEVGENNEGIRVSPSKRDAAFSNPTNYRVLFSGKR